MKITVLSCGKIKEPFLSIANEYFKRSQRFAKVEDLFYKESIDYEEKVVELKNKLKAKLILLDEKGWEPNSRDFAGFLSKSELDGNNLLFVLGCADGHSDSIKENADKLLSLSKLTFPHDFAAAIFAESLYRALSIKAGHPYHRE